MSFKWKLKEARKRERRYKGEERKKRRGKTKRVCVGG